jgi:hypothetical protein
MNLKLNCFEKTKEAWGIFSFFSSTNVETKNVRTIAYNVLPLAVSGGFGTLNCQTKIKVIWNTEI